METHPLYINLRPVGRAEISGARLYAECERQDFIVRLYDGAENLGVMTPERGRFVLRRENFRLKSGLYLIRSSPGDAAIPPLFFPLSHGETRPDLSFLKDELLKRCLENTPGLYGAYFGEDRYYYFPAAMGETPMAPFLFALTPVYAPDGLFFSFLWRRGEIKTIFSSFP